MAQVTLRLEDQLALDIKAVARQRGESVNAFASFVLRAVVDPDTADGESQRIRERLALAGLLATPLAVTEGEPDPEALARARSEAGAGKPLSEYVSEGRG